MLPNVCFPLFPVVDYKTFRRNYYNDDSYRIYQTGVRWMVRGTVHLILYRLVYYHLVLSPAEVMDLRDLGQYMLANFFLYLRVSGQFHLIVGMLHLFGFHLPETHHRYYLASSFTDFWRRINIYWKDFMMKVFYYPAFFKLRGLGNNNALVLSTLFVFLVTWFLHSYQWFWLRGSFLAARQDIFFWGVLALLVVANSLHEARHGRKRSLTKSARSSSISITRALTTAGTFVIICLLWSIWTSNSFWEWRTLWTPIVGW
jgi:D-alanyl-lipoteichoic acid acyltransferase DltB (MBOAT superfamily)